MFRTQDWEDLCPTQYGDMVCFCIPKVSPHLPLPDPSNFPYHTSYYTSLLGKTRRHELKRETEEEELGEEGKKETQEEESKGFDKIIAILGFPGLALPDSSVLWVKKFLLQFKLIEPDVHHLQTKRASNNARVRAERRASILTTSFLGWWLVDSLTFSKTGLAV